ncbi:protein-glucosylgalactosylhydroxylysine glucosidase isoform X3 [Marmota marmota marmota]|uniref:protein-glucosylgalactosylhydroxylysine glucosidase isoform X3 n=1 Tax=Marmota marmota marmota TaxID=9994 RepID=UPI00209324C7|nr:protein-glucosylgalactosylhydroxylysine glucosidase isoform X3 [Marmota marmota marmota]
MPSRSSGHRGEGEIGRRGRNHIQSPQRSPKSTVADRHLGGQRTPHSGLWLATATTNGTTAGPEDTASPPRGEGAPPRPEPSAPRAPPRGRLGPGSRPSWSRVSGEARPPQAGPGQPDPGEPRNADRRSGLSKSRGSFLHTLGSSSFQACQRIYAHRTLPHILASSVSVARLDAGSSPVTVLLRSSFSLESPDLDLHLGPDFQGFRYLYGHTLTPEQPGGPRQEVHMLWTPVPLTLTLGEHEKNRTWDFLTVVGSSQAEAQAYLQEALQLQARGSLYSAHTQSWAQLWAGCGLDVVGPLPLRQALRGSLYYLLSALPQPGALGYVCHGLSPGGLSNGSQEECYWGHVFWDQDLWMFPNILIFHPEAARAILEYRIRTLSGALENARNLGYQRLPSPPQGAKFAWESAGSGLEVCPEDIYGAQEIHINGAVLLAFQLYYDTTQDLQLFREAGGWDVVSAVAEFWCSRVEWSSREKQYHLRGVMPPDEFHSGVNNSTYTNVLVQTSLHFAAGLAEDLGLPVPNQWLVVADKIKVPFDPERNFHPEFDGYEPGEEVKQADVVLLGYPVPFPLSPDVRRKNLEMYEAVTSPQGPAMTWSMFAVGWMELKDPLRARRLLDRSLTNVTEPFKVWTENADGSGAVNFLTGMGGFLQAVLFGTTGLRVTRAGMTFDPLCPAGVSGVCVSGISYQGNKLNFIISEDSMTVEVTAQAGPWAPLLEAELWPSQVRLPLLPGHKASFPHSAGRIQRSLP